ncbi:hypothetical protein G5C51_27320 [Streptomyces sp. A7024]|uniref:Uncharacterized protein n=1 Tax=Streptomyces coryli TaxID=1128680 RepID=A0A6G4U8U4_9ACTN|nr:hypothetical protein [Streptomyces coryli]NGN67601.1 hypothetical protein [Streptomyces coryli]
MTVVSSSSRPFEALPERAYATSGITVRRVPDVAAATVQAVLAALQHLRPVAVIAADAQVESLACALWNADVALSAVPVLSATPAPGKSTRYDHVVLVEPAAIAESGPRGLHCLQAVATCAVYRLDVLHARPLPSGAMCPDGIRLRTAGPYAAPTGPA